MRNGTVFFTNLLAGINDSVKSLFVPKAQSQSGFFVGGAIFMGFFGDRGRVVVASRGIEGGDHHQIIIEVFGNAVPVGELSRLWWQ